MTLAWKGAHKACSAFESQAPWATGGRFDRSSGSQRSGYKKGMLNRISRFAGTH